MVSILAKSESVAPKFMSIFADDENVSRVVLPTSLNVMLDGVAVVFDTTAVWDLRCCW